MNRTDGIFVFTELHSYQIIYTNVASTEICFELCRQGEAFLHCVPTISEFHIATPTHCTVHSLYMNTIILCIPNSRQTFIYYLPNLIVIYIFYNEFRDNWWPKSTDIVWTVLIQRKGQRRYWDTTSHPICTTGLENVRWINKYTVNPTDDQVPVTSAAVLHMPSWLRG